MITMEHYMEQVFYIDLKEISTREELHALLRKELPLPEYYGDNLDAFYDVLTEQGEGWNIIFYNCTKVQTGNKVDEGADNEGDTSITHDISSYINKLEKLCDRAASECDNLKVRFFS